MGKRIVQQARGKGSLTYRVRRKAFSHRIHYPKSTGEGEILKLIHSAGHTAPLLKIKVGKDIFFNPAFNEAFVGQKVSIGEGEAIPGNILPLKLILPGTQIFNIEKNPNDGGKMMRAAGTSAILSKILENGKAIIAMPNKRQVILNENCRATIGKIAGDGRMQKPLMSAGQKYHKMKARSKLWPRVSAVAVNAVDHPFGSGRGKNVGPKIAKRNSPPGQKVGHIRPRRTGWKK